MHVCEKLSEINESGLQTCLKWQIQVVENTPVLPELTLVEGNAIGFACLSLLATVHVIKMCQRALS